MAYIGLRAGRVALQDPVNLVAAASQFHTEEDRYIDPSRRVGVGGDHQQAKRPIRAPGMHS
jgi:hypothetical protein